MLIVAGAAMAHGGFCNIDRAIKLGGCKMKIDRTSTVEPASENSREEDATPPHGDEITPLGVPDSEVTANVRAAFTTLLADIGALRGELAAARERIGELEGLADRDPLLEILNRRAFARELDRALAMIDRYGAQVSLLIIDLNDLKTINDRKGHAAGDAALAHIAGVLVRNVRQTDVVARLGGDEFAVLLMQSDATIAAKKGREIAALIAAAPVDWRDAPFTAGISWGAVEIDPGLTAQDAMNLADQAMYAAKRKKMIRR